MGSLVHSKTPIKMSGKHNKKTSIRITSIVRNTIARCRPDVLPCRSLNCVAKQLRHKLILLYLAMILSRYSAQSYTL